jgi:superfamily I DNA/RNA helicase
MIDWKDFIACNRSLLIAPAGHGKTTAIADCILQCPEDSCQLILTHTHAGIASLRTKFKNKNIPHKKYQLETITGFAQRYVLSYLGSSKLPSEDDKSYFNIAVEECKLLLQSSVVQTILKISYGGVFVDEYQDCTIAQHNMIMTLASNMPLHVLGDPLQGIFSFESSALVNFDNDLNIFTKFELLNHPWRWKDTNPVLGQCISNIRESLIKGELIELNNLKINGLYVINSSEENEKFSSLINIINKEKNILVIYPSYHEVNKYGNIQLRGDLNDRIRLKQRVDFSNKFSLIDAIDSSEYYSCAKLIDDFLSKCKKGRKIKRVARFYDILEHLHLNSSEISKWINKSRNTFVKRTKVNAIYSEELAKTYSQFEATITLENLKILIEKIIALPKIKCYHRDFYHTINNCLGIAIKDDISLFEAMKLVKTRIRHQGRKINDNCIGTTLLTKGLEFDTVIIWDANKFEDAKNFYVAISRACKNLYILSEKSALKFTII